MPVWTVTVPRNIDEVTNTRWVLGLSREDRQVISSSITYDAAHLTYTFTVDTGQHPRPENEELFRWLELNQDPPPRVETPLTRVPLIGFRRIGEESNQNGDVIPDRQRIISEYLGSAEGRTRLAASLAAPLRQRIDYQSVARRTFMVEQLPDGALPFYAPEPVEIPNWVIPGAWVENPLTHTIAQVVSVDDMTIYVDEWPSSVRHGMTRGSFNEAAWEERQEPKPKTWYERLLDSDS